MKWIKKKHHKYIKKSLQYIYEKNVYKNPLYKDEDDIWGATYADMITFLQVAKMGNIISDYKIKWIQKTLTEKTDNNYPKIEVIYWLTPDDEEKIILLYKEDRGMIYV